MRLFRAGVQDPVRCFELSTPICYRSERVLTVQVRAEVRESAYAVIQKMISTPGGASETAA